MVDGRSGRGRNIIKEDVRVWTLFVWLRIEFSRGLL
jgi:hypothetical protein